MTYSTFHALRVDAVELPDFDRFAAEVGSAAIEDDYIDRTMTILRAIHDIRTVKDLRALTGLSQAAFSAAYGIPKRTLENWEASGAQSRTCSPHVFELLLFSVLSDL